MKSKKKSQTKKELILDAALKIVSRDGLRGLTYRAVAKEADVPLGLTTYYFKGIESLYTEAYQRFVVHSAKRLGDLVEKGAVLLEAYHLKRKDKPQLALQKLIQGTSALVSGYVYSLIKDEREYRLMGMAFIHAALTNPEINATVRESEMQFNIASEAWFTAFGSADPALMADMLVGIVNHAEHRCLLGMNGSKDKEYLDRTMLGFFQQVLGASANA